MMGFQAKVKCSGDSDIVRPDIEELTADPFYADATRQHVISNGQRSRTRLACT